MKKTTCSFTGHRYISGSKLRELSDKLQHELRLLIDEGYTSFISGGAIGFDLLAARTVIKLREEFPHIRLDLALPCADQAKKWNPQQQQAYRDILRQADSVTYVSPEYYSGCMHKRNRFLIDNSSVCVAFYNGTRGGTAYTVSYAADRSVRVVNLYA